MTTETDKRLAEIRERYEKHAAVVPGTKEALLARWDFEVHAYKDIPWLMAQRFAAERLCQVYFRIAVKALGEEEVCRARDAIIAEIIALEEAGEEQT